MMVMMLLLMMIIVMMSISDDIVQYCTLPRPGSPTTRTCMSGRTLKRHLPLPPLSTPTPPLLLIPLLLPIDSLRSMSSDDDDDDDDMES